MNVRDAQATAVRLRRQGFEVAEFAVPLAEHGVFFVEIFVLNAPAWAPFFITYEPPRHELTMVGVARDELRVLLPGANVEFELGEKEAITAMTLSGEHPGNISIDGLALRAAA